MAIVKHLKYTEGRVIDVKKTYTRLGNPQYIITLDECVWSGHYERTKLRTPANSGNDFQGLERLVGEYACLTIDEKPSGRRHVVKAARRYI